MFYILYILLFLLGLCVGSFLNAVIYRLEKGESVIFEKKKTLLPSDEGRCPEGGGVLSDKRYIQTTPPPTPSSTEEGGVNSLARSRCPHCRQTLAWYDLIPVLSFLFLRGKCRYCGKRISWQYPIVEIVTALLFVSVFFIFAQGHSGRAVFDWATLCYALYVTCSLVVIFVYDLKYYIIPDKVLFPAIAVSIMYHALSIMRADNYTLYIIHNTLYCLGSAVIASGFFLSLVLISRGRWMGMGDVKLAFLMGLVLGWPNILVALFLAFFFGAAIGVALILSGSKTLKSQIPFGPFLVAGTFVALFWGERLVSWYWGLLF